MERKNANVVIFINQIFITDCFLISLIIHLLIHESIISFFYYYACSFMSQVNVDLTAPVFVFFFPPLFFFLSSRRLEK